MNNLKVGDIVTVFGLLANPYSSMDDEASKFGYMRIKVTHHTPGKRIKVNAGNSLWDFGGLMEDVQVDEFVYGFLYSQIREPVKLKSKYKF